MKDWSYYWSVNNFNYRNFRIATHFLSLTNYILFLHLYHIHIILILMVIYVWYNNMFYTLHYIIDLFHICMIQWNIIKGWRIVPHMCWNLHNLFVNLCGLNETRLLLVYAVSLFGGNIFFYYYYYYYYYYLFTYCN